MEEYHLVEQWKAKVNRSQYGSAVLAAIVTNFFKNNSTPPVGVEDFLPFRAPPHYLTVEEADAAFAAAFGIK